MDNLVSNISIIDWWDITTIVESDNKVLLDDEIHLFILSRHWFYIMLFFSILLLQWLAKVVRGGGTGMCDTELAIDEHDQNINEQETEKEQKKKEEKLSIIRF